MMMMTAKTPASWPEGPGSRRRTRRLWPSLGLAWTVVAALASGTAQAATCTADDFAQAIDQAGVKLREFNADAGAKLQARIQQLKDVKRWTDADFETKAQAFLSDARLTALDQQAEELLINIDALGQPPEKQPLDCSKLAELQAASIELLSVMRAKAAHSHAKIDKEIGSPVAAADPSARQAAPSPPPAQVAVPRTPAVPAAPPRPPASPQPSAQPPPATVPATPRPDDWAAVTQVAPAQGLAANPAASAEDGYSIDEIREVTRGVFGTVSTELASVIEHAFRKSGRPSAYILGQEGGGAFLAGLRYGNGILYPRRGAQRPLYWHGPSVGYDFGAAGSRTLFLIYGLSEPDAIFRRFTGLDGSAYLVGGVGITFLKGGDVTMAPIRSGLGLRLGASVGYIRFTDKPTWNPF